jgi:hypothetical protein
MEICDYHIIGGGSAGDPWLLGSRKGKRVRGFAG